MKIVTLAITIILIVTVNIVAEGKTSSKEIVNAEKKEVVDHSVWSAELKKYVTKTGIKYSEWQKDQGKLDSYLAAMAKINHSKLKKNDRMAFYINVYNAATIKLVLKSLPKKIKSIRDIPDTWKAKIVKLHDKMVSLDHIEHEWLRKIFKDSRIHFAVNCASKGCPDLWGQSYSGGSLSKELDDARSRFVSNASKGVKVIKEKGTLYGYNYYVYASKIFDWFDEDFERETKTVIDYIQKHGTKTQKEFIKNNKDEISIKYFDYDWKLNGK